MSDPDAVKLKQRIDDLKKELEAEKHAWAAFEGEVKKLRILEFEADGYIKTYKDICQKSDGLTTLRPSVVKALNDLNDKPSKALRAKAVEGLEKHLSEVAKEHADALKKDAKLKARFDAFKKAVESVVAGFMKQNSIP